MPFGACSSLRAAFRPGRVFGKALHQQSLLLTGLEHLPDAVAGVGMIGVGMEIDSYHDGFLSSES